MLTASSTTAAAGHTIEMQQLVDAETEDVANHGVEAAERTARRGNQHEIDLSEPTESSRGELDEQRAVPLVVERRAHSSDGVRQIGVVGETAVRTSSAARRAGAIIGSVCRD